jgi:hypothetical protein
MPVWLTGMAEIAVPLVRSSAGRTGADVHPSQFSGGDTGQVWLGDATAEWLFSRAPAKGLRRDEDR